MTQARQNQISLADTPYYHCVNRCVRRAFLCGEDHVTGVSYEHRKQWIVDRLKALASVFAIDVCAYAVMSNHYHVVLKVRPLAAQGWDAELVVARWRQLFRGSLLVDRYMAGSCGTEVEREAAEAMIEEWRERLFDISWFMRCLNEGIAREANREDGCKGRFWEGRFKSQALLDERALLACMAYVDLNPIRAGLAESPEASEFTSVQERLQAFGRAADAGDVVVPQADVAAVADCTTTASGGAVPANEGLRAGDPSWLGTSAPLAAFVGAGGDLNEAGLPFHLAEYLLLVDWTGRQWREGKRGAISSALPPLLARLNVDASTWIETVRRFQSDSKGAFHEYVGPVAALQRRSDALGRRWLRGVGACRALWGVDSGAETPTPNVGPC